jgi:hypothetical protein
MKTPPLWSRPATWVSILLFPALLAAQAAPEGPPEERMRAALDQAAERGIPTALLESKIAEGRAKGVPMERIAMATEQRLTGLLRAQQAMAGAPGGVDAAQLGVGADALAAGVSDQMLSELAGDTPGTQRALAVAALAYLVEQGAMPDHAMARVQEALARGPAALADLPGAAVGPPFGTAVPGRRGPPEGVQTGPPSAVPTPGRPGPPSPPGGPPAGPPRGPPGGSVPAGGGGSGGG